jgi:hypothetical protein
MQFHRTQKASQVGLVLLIEAIQDLHQVGHQSFLTDAEAMHGQDSL